MKRVGIIGASGMAGSAIYQAGLKNPDLEVIGIARNKKKAQQVLGDDANLLTGDIFTMTDSVLKRFDVIIDAFSTDPTHADQQVKLAEKLITLAQKHQVRVIFILGAGSLHTGDDQHLVVEDLAKTNDAAAWINTPRQQLKELKYLETVTDADWLGISPAMTFKDGPATDYSLGSDQLLFNTDHDSVVTVGTMAKLVITEIIDPQHHQERITVVNQ